MPKVDIHLQFDSIDECRGFFGGPTQFPAPTSAPSSQPAASTAAPAAPSPTVVPIVAPVLPAPSTPMAALATSAPTAYPDPAKALVQSVLDAANAMYQRIPGGAGPAKGKEILAKHSLTRIRDIKDAAIAQAVIADFQAAA